MPQSAAKPKAEQNEGAPTSRTAGYFGPCISGLQWAGVRRCGYAFASSVALNTVCEGCNCKRVEAGPIEYKNFVTEGGQAYSPPPFGGAGGVCEWRSGLQVD